MAQFSTPHIPLKKSFFPAEQVGHRAGRNFRHDADSMKNGLHQPDLCER